MKHFFACSVGEPGKDYIKSNFQRILESKAFILHENTKQKGVYEEIKSGDVLFLKYNNAFVAYGISKGIEKIDEEEWNLSAPVDEWYFKNPLNTNEGVDTYGIGDSTISGGQYGTVKQLNQSFGYKKMEEIDSSTNAYYEVKKEYLSLADSLSMQMNISLLEYKKQIILQGPPGTGKTRIAKAIAREIIGEDVETTINDQAIAKYLVVGQELRTAANYNTFTILEINLPSQYIKVKPLKAKFEYNVKFDLIKKCYEGKGWNDQVTKWDTSGNASYLIPIARYLFDKLNAGDISERLKVIQFHPSYTYEDFVRGIVVETDNKGIPQYKVINKVLAEFATRAMSNPSTKYVLIIDEINRANLSSVMGELIYALEYRYKHKEDNKSEAIVESMYALKESNQISGRELCLPDNLYIIGTMNTADRSVGHIDYAIRRRFAFVDVLPSGTAIENVIIDDLTRQKALSLFKQVEQLFKEKEEVQSDEEVYLQADFKAKEVQLGHSYFLADTLELLRLKLQYEIKPLLYEYIKDGILSDTAKSTVDALSQNI